ncbi:hypothetical protein GGI11_002957 [Coemansia sp. RSA 2049]|nr:hypothetical protein GGI11_002957 [Coemansia sp. RSA 2049]
MVIHTCPVTVLRGGDWLQVASECLVPGDIIDLGSSKLSTLPCDAVVLEGDCIVNESMLTGESVPEFKYPLEKRSEFFSKIDMAACTFKPFISRHMVFAGTRLVRVRKTESAYGCMATETPQENMRATAMVLRTGFCSTKGGLVRSILFPRPTKFQFYRDAFRFVGILAVVAVIGFAVNTVNLHSLGVSASTIAIKALDLITVVVPPALPASMSIGMAFAAVLVDHLQELGYIAGFCGDGANDCAALKTADVGISLSEAEASVAAPFTSRVSDISCVADVLKEGRCSIATSFGCFKYMMLYSMIQFTTCCLLYIYNTNLTNGQFLYVDLFIIIPIAVCMNRAKPFKKLVPKRPSASLISKRVLTSLVGNIALIIGFQIAIYFMTGAQSWYKKPVPKKADDPDSTPLEGHLNTSIFLFSTFQYIFTGLIFSIGPPYRQPISQNRLYLATLVILLAFDLWMVLVPVKGFYSLFGLVHVSVGWRFVILGMGVANFVLCYCGEQYLFPWVAPRAAKVVRFFRLVWNRYLQREYVGDRTNTSKCLENGAGTRNVTTSGIWQRAGKRENRKDYKLVLEKMPGKAEWY